MKNIIKWIVIGFVGIILFLLLIVFFIYKKVVGKKEYNFEVLENLDEVL